MGRTKKKGKVTGNNDLITFSSSIPRYMKARHTRKIRDGRICPLVLLHSYHTISFCILGQRGILDPPFCDFCLAWRLGEAKGYIYSFFFFPDEQKSCPLFDFRLQGKHSISSIVFCLQFSFSLVCLFVVVFFFFLLTHIFPFSRPSKKGRLESLKSRNQKKK